MDNTNKTTSSIIIEVIKSLNFILNLDNDVLEKKKKHFG
jgi:hypothetical protein